MGTLRYIDILFDDNTEYATRVAYISGLLHFIVCQKFDSTFGSREDTVCNHPDGISGSLDNILFYYMKRDDEKFKKVIIKIYDRSDLSENIYNLNQSIGKTEAVNELSTKIIKTVKEKYLKWIEESEPRDFLPFLNVKWTDIDDTNYEARVYAWPQNKELKVGYNWEYVLCIFHGKEDILTDLTFFTMANNIMLLCKDIIEDNYLEYDAAPKYLKISLAVDSFEDGEIRTIGLQTDLERRSREKTYYDDGPAILESYIDLDVDVEYSKSDEDPYIEAIKEETMKWMAEYLEKYFVVYQEQWIAMLYEQFLTDYKLPYGNLEHKRIIGAHLEKAIEEVRTNSNSDRIQELEKLLNDNESMYNPKYDLYLDGKDFFMRIYIEDGRSWIWITDDRSDSTPIFQLEVTKDSYDHDLRDYQAICDYLIDRSELN